MHGGDRRSYYNWIQQKLTLAKHEFEFDHGVTTHIVLFKVPNQMQNQDLLESKKELCTVGSR